MKVQRLRVVLLAPALAAIGCDSDNDSRPPASRIVVGAVYVPTNEDDNRVAAFARHDDGSLTFVEMYDTGGRGTGGRIVPRLDRVITDPLFSQDSAVLSPDRRLLFVVNAGDASISSFRINADLTLTLADQEGTGGAFPNSIAVNERGVLYVSNVNSPNNPFNPGGTEPATITGFRFDAQGALTPIPNSTHPLSSEASLPTHVLFDPSGDRLFVAELFAKTIAVYPADPDGVLGQPQLNATKVNAFGLAFIGPDVLVTSDVSPMDQGGAGSASSFRVQPDGSLAPLSLGVGNGKITPCWTAVMPDGRFAFTSNLDDGDVSSFAQATGMLTLVHATAAAKPPAGAVSAENIPTSGPVDSFVTPDGRFFYQQFGGRGSIVAYRIAEDGALTEVGEFGNDRLPLAGSEGAVGF